MIRDCLIMIIIFIIFLGIMKVSMDRTIEFEIEQINKESRNK